MIDYVEQGEVKQLLVQRKDGSTWRAEIGLDGRVRLLEQLNQPEAQETEADHDADDSSGAQGEVVDQPSTPDKQEEPGGQGEADSGQGEDQADQSGEWGSASPLDDSKGLTDSEVDDLIAGMQHRGSEANDSNGHRIPDEYRLDDNYHKKLQDPAFSSRLRSVMLDNKYARRVRGRTRGKLDMGRLFKVPVMSRNVFLQKQERKGKLYNVVLVIDQSGSMGGRKEQLAAEIALFLTKQFEHMNINIGVIGYGDYVAVHKELNNSKVNYDELYMKLLEGQGGTNDYPALRRAYHMFRTAPEGKNIMIHLSDGSPGSYIDTKFVGVDGREEHIKQLPPLIPDRYDMRNYVNYNDKTHLHHLIKSHPEVAAFGVGIQAGGWQEPDHVVVHKLDEIKPAVLKFLRTHITRG